MGANLPTRCESTMEKPALSDESELLAALRPVVA